MTAGRGTVPCYGFIFCPLIVRKHGNCCHILIQFDRMSVQTDIEFPFRRLRGKVEWRDHDGDALPLPPPRSCPPFAPNLFVGGLAPGRGLKTSKKTKIGGKGEKKPEEEASVTVV